MRRKTHRQPADPESFSRMLGTYGLKQTPQRMAVHRAMLKLIHADADTVYDAVVAEGACRIARSSVYNILSSLADTGIYARRYSSNGKVMFDINAWRHIHLYDTQNQNWRDLNDAELVSWFDAHFKGRRFRGYKIDGFEVLLLCHPTRKTARAK